jgi:hypothetical protein
MKTLLSITLLIMLSISMISCIPSDAQKSKVINQYFTSTTLFECKVVALREPTYQDSSRFTTDIYYVLAKDIWDAQRLFEDKLANLRSTLNGSEVYWNPIPISDLQKYPYTYE